MSQLYFNSETVQRIQMKRSWFQFLKDRLSFPLLCLISPQTSIRFGLTPIDEERLRYVKPLIRGKLLDVACGDNVLVRSHGQGIGVDVHPWAGVDQVLPNTAHLPFESGSFDSVSILAALNHIPERQELLQECKRVLTADGRLIITMLNPWVSILCHWIRSPHDPDQHERTASHGEVHGFWKRDLFRLLKDSGFQKIESRAFLFGLNRIYICHR